MSRIVAGSIAAALFISASANAAPPVQSVNVVNTPSVAISGTPTVNVANLPGGGTRYQEGLGVSFSGNGAGSGVPSSAVPGGKRRIITAISARQVCPIGQGALVQVFANGAIFLPMQFTHNDGQGRATYAMAGQFNFIMTEGMQMTPIIETFGGLCQADIFLHGVEIDQP
jgi:hypothetical protein